MPSRDVALLGELGVGVSSRVSLMRLSYDHSTVVPLSRRITYGGDVGSSDVIDYFSKSSGTGDAAVLILGLMGLEYSWWCRGSKYLCVELTRRYLVGRAHEWGRSYFLVDRK